MNKQKLLLAFAGLALLASACGKKATKAYYYTVDNNSSHKMNYKIYQWQDDFNSGLNPFISYTLQPGEQVQIPTTQFLDTRTYYQEWYSDDYGYGSWLNRQHIRDVFSAAFSPSPSNYTGVHLDVMHDYARQLCLSGSGTQTTWEAVDGWNFVNGSIGDTIWWAQMNPFQKYHQMVFNKDFNCHFYYKEQNTGVMTNYGFYLRTPDDGTPLGSNVGKLYIYTANDWDSLGNITYHIWPTGDGGYKVSDTMLVAFGDKGTWTMVKTDTK